MSEQRQQADSQAELGQEQYTEAEWAAYWQYYGKCLPRVILHLGAKGLVAHHRI